MVWSIKRFSLEISLEGSYHQSVLGALFHTSIIYFSLRLLFSIFSSTEFTDSWKERLETAAEWKFNQVNGKTLLSASDIWFLGVTGQISGQREPDIQYIAAWHACRWWYEPDSGFRPAASRSTEVRRRRQWSVRGWTAGVGLRTAKKDFTSECRGLGCRHWRCRSDGQ